MKSIFFTIVLLLIATFSSAATITFVWDANPAEEQITGYRIYQDSGTSIVLDVAATATTAVLSNVTGNHAYSIVAYRLETDGSVTESDHSNYVIYTHTKVVPTKPTLNATATK